MARVVRVDDDPSAIDGDPPADLAVLGDARETAAALADELERRGYQSTGYRTADMAARIADRRDVDGMKDRGRDGLLDPRILMREIDRILPPDRAVVLEAGHCTSFMGGYLSATDAESFYFPHGFGSIGASLGFALGAAIARPDRLTVHAGGDGSFMMTVADVDTAVRYRLPVLFLVLNDLGFGAEVHSLEINGIAGDLARYQNPPLEAVARGLGAEGVTIESLDDVRRLQERIAHLSGPLLADCRVDPRIEADYLQLMITKPRS